MIKTLNARDNVLVEVDKQHMTTSWGSLLLVTSKQPSHRYFLLSIEGHCIVASRVFIRIPHSTHTRTFFRMNVLKRRWRLERRWIQRCLIISSYLLLCWIQKKIVKPLRSIIKLEGGDVSGRHLSMIFFLSWHFCFGCYSWAIKIVECSLKD